jgi:hypothetical protein
MEFQYITNATKSILNMPEVLETKIIRGENVEEKVRHRSSRLGDPLNSGSCRPLTLTPISKTCPMTWHD